MNEKQRRFCEYYAKHCNATAAAIAAGYSERSAYSVGARLLKNDEIKKYLHELQRHSESERIAGINEVKQIWSDILRDPAARTSARIRAGEMLTRSAGILVENAAYNENRPVEAEKGETPKDIVKICLPYTGRYGEALNAAQTPDGEVYPLAGHENEEMLYYQPFIAMDPAQWEYKGEENEEL